MRAPDPGPAWLRAPSSESLVPPGRLFRGLAKLLRSSTHRELDGASAGYFEWQAGTTRGAWEYYASFLPEEPKRVLDVGAGAGGRSLGHMRSTSGVFVCLDRRPALAASAGREIRRRGLERLAPIAGDAYSMPFRSESFDACLCENALEHLDRPDAALAEIQRVLKPGARLFLLFPPWRGAYAGHLRWLTWLPWIHLLPTGLLVRLVSGLLRVRPGRDDTAWREDAAGLLAGLARELNGWPLRRLLESLARVEGLSLLGAHVLGQGTLGRALRLLPWAGEMFTSAVYLVVAKQKGGASPPLSYNQVLVQSLGDTLKRRRGWR